MVDNLNRLREALAGRYAIEQELGAGGMATVYVAEDLKHDRKVAVKVLRPELAAVLGAERFVQEIKTTASLQHPHILPLHDSGDAKGFLYYVMPYIEGETLRDKLNRETQLGIEEALKITTEVADALDYAHRHNVIHRDIKPENILLHDGRPMVADFGIALALSAAAGGRMTETGMSLGTPHYMSPEQATADRDITNRSDIYSLGSVLFEMLTGEPPHLGNSAQQIIMKIITDTARPVSELRKSVPPNVTLAVARALEKLPADRFETAADFAAALANPAFAVSSPIIHETAGAPAPRMWNRLNVVTTGLAFVFAMVAVWALLRPSAPRTPSYFDIALPTGYRLASGQIRPFALSPDGRRIAFVAQPENGAAQLFLRERSEPDARALPATEGARDPFFSPDGEWVGFLTGTEMFKVGLNGGRPQPLSNLLALPMGVSRWGPHDSIAVPLATGLVMVPATGGQAAANLSFGGFTLLGEPAWSGDERTIVTSLLAGELLAPAVVELATGTNRTAEELRGALVVAYLPDGQLIFDRGGLLSAVPFDVRTGKPHGNPRPLADGVEQTRTDAAGPWAAVTPRALAYVKARPSPLVWVDRQGRAEAIDGVLGRIRRPKLSPDGRRVVYQDDDEPGRNVLTWYDLARGTSNRVGSGGLVGDPIWTADGNAVTFIEIGQTGAGLITIPITGDATREIILQVPLDSLPSAHSWSPDGRYLAYFVVTSGGRDIRILDRHGSPRDFIVTEFNERSPAFSPDGRWIAYASDRSGRTEIWVTSFPDREVTRQVSTGGGRVPRWAHDGSEIFYRWGDAMYAVSVQTRPRLDIGVPEALFSGSYLADAEESGSQDYDVAGDGRFLMVQQDPVTHIQLILDWR